MPKVSVAIPTYNYARFLGEAIQSVLDQTFEDFELIIVDDGSTDSTREVVMSFKDGRIKYIYQKNRGVSAARNTGITASVGEYVAFLDADDMWLPQKLALQVKAMDSAPRAGVVYTDHYHFDPRTGLVTRTSFQNRKRPPPRGRVLEQFIESFLGTPSTLLIRRDVFAQVGMFDETLKGCEDDDMLFRMASRFEFEVVPEPLIKKRMHASQITQQPRSYLPYHLAYLYKAIQSPVLNDQMRAKMRNDLAEYHFRYGTVLIRGGKLGTGGRELLASLTISPLKFGLLTMSFPGRILNHLFALVRIRAQVFRFHRN